MRKIILIPLAFFFCLTIMQAQEELSIVEYGMIEIPEFEDKEFQKLIERQVEFEKKYYKAIEDNDPETVKVLISTTNELVSKINQEYQGLIPSDIDKFRTVIDNETKAKRLFLGLRKVPVLENKKAQQLVIKTDTLILSIINNYKIMTDEAAKMNKNIETIDILLERMIESNNYYDMDLLKSYSEALKKESSEEDVISFRYKAGNIPQFKDKEVQRKVEEIDASFLAFKEVKMVLKEELEELKKIPEQVKEINPELEDNLKDSFKFREYMTNTMEQFSEEMEALQLN